MKQLFKKTAIFTDIHWGKKSDSEIYSQDCSEYIDWFIQLVKSNECDSIIFLGDAFENGKTMSTLTLNYVIDAVDRLNQLDIPIYWCIGNHDLFYKENRRIHALPWLKFFSNVTVIN